MLHMAGCDSQLLVKQIVNFNFFLWEIKKNIGKRKNPSFSLLFYLFIEKVNMFLQRVDCFLFSGF
jgi:hypothetical protein